MIPDLRFDAQDILATLQPWVLCESPTHDAAAVNRMMSVAARDLALLGATVEMIPGRMGLSDCVRARFPHRDRDLGPAFWCSAISTRCIRSAPSEACSGGSRATAPTARASST